MSGILNLYNFDLVAVGIVTAAIGILGFTIFYSNRESITNRKFLSFSLLTIVYSIINYFSYQTGSLFYTLWLLRLTIFFAVWHAFAFFELAYVYPQEKTVFPRSYKIFLRPIVIITSVVTLSSLVFERIEKLAPAGQATAPVIGPGMALFGIIAGVLVVGGLYSLFQKSVRAQGIEKKQLITIFVGAVIMFIFILIFNIISPAFFNNVRLIPITPIFLFFFIAFTAYAIRRYGLLHIKIIATEILVFLLVVSTFFEVLISKSTGEIIFRIGIFTVSLVFSIFLIRSVRKEVEQRERLQVLTQELEIANVELAKLDKAKSEFISIASHQLRAPLTVIKGYVSLFLEGTFGALTAKGKESLERVAFAAQQLVKLVNDLLDLSRIESGRIRYDSKETDFVELVSAVMDELRPHAKEKEITLRLENKANTPLPFSFDPDKIREVVINLLDNAIKYSQKGIVEVAIEHIAASQSVRLSVKDQGLGIHQEDIERLFNKFTRMEAARRVDPNGTGIGLYFVKRVVEDHGGKVWVESEGAGKGSTFFVELPMKQTNP